MHRDSQDSATNGESMLSLSFIIRELGDDPIIIQDMLQTFREVLLEFDSTISNKNELEGFRHLKIALHKIKPSIRMFNLSEPLKKIDDLEVKLNNEAEPIYVEAKVADLRKMIPPIITEIDRFALKYR